MRKIAIVDNEAFDRSLLSDYATRFSAEQKEPLEVSCFESGTQFLESCAKEFDLVFLDIDMPGLDGMKTAQELRQIDQNICIIFVTNLAQYAINGYEVNAFDFVIKPVQYGSFKYKLDKALRFLSIWREEKHLFLSTGGTLHKLNISEIYYIEADGAYVQYHTIDGIIRTRGPLKEIEKELVEDGFARCNHGYLINLKYVTDIISDTVTVGGTELKISRPKKKEFINSLAVYLGRKL